MVAVLLVVVTGRAVGPRRKETVRRAAVRSHPLPVRRRRTARRRSVVVTVAMTVVVVTVVVVVVGMVVVVGVVVVTGSTGFGVDDRRRLRIRRIFVRHVVLRSFLFVVG